MLERLSSSARNLGTRLHATGPSLTLRRAPRPDRRVVTGLDIEPGHLIAAQASLNGHVSVERAAGAPLGAGVVRDGEVADAAALIDALRELFEAHDLDRRVRVGLANQRAVVRTLELPPISDARELDAAVRFQAQDQIPMPLDSVVLDFHDLGVVETEAGPRQRVVLVAARRDMVERLLDVLEAAGLRPEGVDLAAFALLRGLSPLPVQGGERVLYLSMAGLTNLVVAEGPVCVFTRPVSTGLEAMAAAVAERLTVPVEQARQLVHGTGATLPRPAAPDASRPEPEADPQRLVQREPEGEPEPQVASHRPVDPEREAQVASERPVDPQPEPQVDPERQVVETAIAEGLRQIAADIRNSLDYHAGLGGGARVERVVLSGPATDVPGLPGYLAHELGLRVEVRGVTEAKPGSAGGLPPSCLSVAAGLSVGEVRA